MKKKIFRAERYFISFLGDSFCKPGLVEDIFRRYTDKINRIA
jgi:hypothetical protein